MPLENNFHAVEAGHCFRENLARRLFRNQSFFPGGIVKGIKMNKAEPMSPRLAGNGRRLLRVQVGPLGPFKARGPGAFSKEKVRVPGKVHSGVAETGIGTEGNTPATMLKAQAQAGVGMIEKGDAVFKGKFF